MKTWLLIVSLMTAGMTARADEVDVALNRALNKLDQNWRVIGQKAPDKFDDAAMAILGVGAGGMGGGQILAAISRSGRLQKVERELLRQRLNVTGLRAQSVGRKLMVGGLLIWLIRDVLRWAEVLPRPPVQPAAYYKQDAKHMSFFFGLPYKDQFRVARSDDELYQFIMELERAYDVIAAGHPPIPPPARP